MYKLLVHGRAQADLMQLARMGTREATAAARIAVLFQELNADPPSLLNLLSHGYGRDRTADFEVKELAALTKRNKNVWLMKFWEILDLGVPYRIIYAYVPTTYRFHILAVVNRNFNYELNHPITIRIVEDYDNL